MNDVQEPMDGGKRNKSSKKSSKKSSNSSKKGGSLNSLLAALALTASAAALKNSKRGGDPTDDEGKEPFNEMPSSYGGAKGKKVKGKKHGGSEGEVPPYGGFADADVYGGAKHKEKVKGKKHGGAYLEERVIALENIVNALNEKVFSVEGGKRYGKKPRRKQGGTDGDGTEEQTEDEGLKANHAELQEQEAKVEEEHGNERERERLPEPAEGFTNPYSPTTGGKKKRSTKPKKPKTSKK